MRPLKRFIALTAVTALLACAQDASAEKFFKNIQALKLTPASDLPFSMNSIASAMDQVRSVPWALLQRVHIDEIRFHEPMDDAKFAIRPAPPK
jgi:hypothetical protein